MSTAAAKLLTAEEFARLPNPPDGSKQELVRGEIVTMPPPGFVHGVVQLNVASLVRAHVRNHKLGRVTVESGVITEQGPDTVRGRMLRSGATSAYRRATYRSCTRTSPPTSSPRSYRRVTPNSG